MIVFLAFITILFLFACCVEVEHERRFPWVSVKFCFAFGVIIWIVVKLTGV